VDLGSDAGSTLSFVEGEGAGVIAHGSPHTRPMRPPQAAVGHLMF
jgi:hypothetical protein